MLYVILKPELLKLSKVIWRGKAEGETGKNKPNLCGNTIVYVGLNYELSWLVRVPDVQTIVLSQTLGLLKRGP